MFKRYFIPVSLLLLIFIVDLVSYKQQPVSDTPAYIQAYTESHLAAHSELVLETGTVALLRSDSLDNEDFNRIRRLEAQLVNNRISATLRDNGRLIFWTPEPEGDTICETFRDKGLRLRLCKQIIGPDGKPGEDIFQNTFITRGNYQSEITDDRFQRFEQLVPLSWDRPYRLNILLGLAYTFIILAVIILSLHHRESIGLGILIMARLALYLSGWQTRFANLDSAESLFPHLTYSSLDLLWDSMIIFGLLCLIVMKTISKSLGHLVGLSLNLFFFSLLTLSHIRLVQLLVNSDMVLNSINDLALLNTTDFICLAAVLIIQAGIFIYGYRIFLAFAKYRQAKWVKYGLLLILASGGVGIAYLTDLNVNSLVLLFFLAAYFLLFDLFADVRSRNITWIIWWAIFYSVYLSALFYNYDIRKNLTDRMNYLRTVIVPVPEERIEDFRQSDFRDSLVYHVEALLTLPEEAVYDKEDFELYSHEKLGRQDFKIEIFDSTGQYIFDKGEFSEVAGRLLGIGKSIAYDELSGTVWFDTLLPSGYRMLTALDVKTPLPPVSYPYNYYRDGRQLYGSLDIDRSLLAQLHETESRLFFHESNAYVIHRPDDRRLLVSLKSYDGLIKPIAFFSLIFCFVVLMSVLLGFGHALFNFLPEEWPFIIQRFDSLNSKIQISLILVILLSFIIIAAITNSFLSSYLTTEKDRFFKDKIASIATELDQSTGIAISKREALAIATNFREEIEKVHNVKLEIVGIDDRSGGISFFPWVWFTRQEYAPPFTDRARGKLVSYLPLRFEGETIGMARIQHGDSMDERSYVVDFLGSVFNVYVFLFLIASVIAIFIARSVTRPLDLLNRKLQELKLGSRNELIDWQGDDEIGTLIANYNNMVHQLEESARILAKTERDSAWREMAKQVAHEIKNPLTPMKLSIQYLEKAIKQKPDRAEEITRRISNTLLEQIENLTEIANAFGNFAEMPQASNVKVELNEVVEIVHNLFRKREDMDIFLSEPIDPVYVYADKNQLIRILNNLIKNAVESIPETRRGKIDVFLEKRKDKAVIRVRDNGVGIPPDMKDKIFQPKFTTKDSGSGLGLAICANMIESMNGRIYFESTSENGTEFFIELDTIRPAHYEDSEKRIILD